MTYDPTNPLIVQGDRSVLLEVDNPKYALAREALNTFILIGFRIFRYGMPLLLA